VLFFHYTYNFQNIRLFEVGLANFSDRIVFILLDVVVNLLEGLEVVFDTPVLFNIAKIRIIFLFIIVAASYIVFNLSCILLPQSLKIVYRYESNYYFKAQDFTSQSTQFDIV
jgi:hypothetical protein